MVVVAVMGRARSSIWFVAEERKGRERRKGRRREGRGNIFDGKVGECG